MFAYLKKGGQLVYEFLRPKKKLGLVSYVFLGVLTLSLLFVFIQPAHAGIVDSLVDAITWIILSVASLFLKLTIFFLTFVIQIAAYNGYLDATAVNYGWVMVRDVTNMGFVVILLIIAFGTILGLEQYEWKKLMVKFVMAAILVNFSRVICGVIIDIGQVIMITFINGVAATAGGNLISMFNADKIMSLTGSADQEVSGGEVFISAVAALFFAATMMAVMFVYVVILLYRMLTLWILIVLSPIAFVTSVIPSTQSYASEWWSEFGKNVTSGPLAAFFLWLAFVTLGGGNINDEVSGASVTDVKIEEAEMDKVGSQSAGISQAMEWNKMANFVIAIGMLLVGAERVQKLGVKGGDMMGKAADFGKKGVAAARWAYDKVGGVKGMAKTVAVNIPGIGGKAWQRRGAWAQEKLLQGAEWWNKKGGSKLGAWAQFGAHDKIMKARKEAIELRKGQVSSAAKGFQGWSVKRTGGIEKLLDRVDALKGEFSVRKEASQMKHAANEAVARKATIEKDADLQAKIGRNSMRKQIAATQEEALRLRIDLDTMLEGSEGTEGIERFGSLGKQIIEASVDRQYRANLKQAALSYGMERVSAPRDMEAISIEQQAGHLAKQEEELTSLERFIKAFNSLSEADRSDFSKVSKIEGGIPDSVASIISKHNTDGKLNVEAISTELNTTYENLAKKHQEEVIEFGKASGSPILVGLNGNLDKQIEILKNIQNELSKPKDQRSFKFDDPAELQRLFGAKATPDNFAEQYASKIQNRNLVAAISALEEIKKQKGKDGKGKVSLANIAKKLVVELKSVPAPVKGQINVRFLGTSSNDQKQSLAEILSKIGLTADSIQHGSLTADMASTLKGVIQREGYMYDVKLQQIGLNRKALEDLVDDLQAGNTDLVRSIQEILSFNNPNK